MRVRVLAILASALAFAACNDSPAPTALSSTDGGTAVAPEAHFNGHNDHTKPVCRDDGSTHSHRHYAFKRGGYGYWWDTYRDRHHRLHRVLRRERLHRHDCPPPDGGGGGEDTPGSVDGTVMNNNAGAVGYPLFLLSPDGGTVAAQGTTGTDGTGTFNFAGVKAGSYLLCEAVPPEPLSQTRPQNEDADHPACPETYAPLGFLVTVTAGTAASGFAFSNMQVD